MRLLLAAVFTNTGIAKATQNPYSMTRAAVLQPFQDVDNQNYQSHGTGFVSVELGVSPNFSNELQKYFNTSFKDSPLQVDVLTQLDRDGRNIITGFEKNAVASNSSKSLSGLNI